MGGRYVGKEGGLTAHIDALEREGSVICDVGSKLQATTADREE